MGNSEIMQQYLPPSAANDCHMHPRKNYSVCPVHRWCTAICTWRL